MGTPDFAVPSLDILVQNGYEVVGVVTTADTFGGRNNKQLIESAVKKYAVSKGLNILQPTNLKSRLFQKKLKALRADLQVVVAFRMLPETVWNMPPIGTINLHGSILPKYRGAAPLNWAVINGDKETGATTFFLKHEIDTGDLIFTTTIPIDENETVGEVHDKLMIKGAELLLKTVKAIENNDYVSVPQDESIASSAPKIFHETCAINFNQTTEKVHNFVRGLSPFPTAWTILNGEKLKIFKTEKEICETTETAGTFVSDGKKELKIATTDGFVRLLEVQMQGRKRMDVKAFLNGYKF